MSNTARVINLDLVKVVDQLGEVPEIPETDVRPLDHMLAAGEALATGLTIEDVAKDRKSVV